jgi:hypothetical protein
VAIESPGDAAALVDNREDAKIRGWRFLELTRAGYDTDAAERLAGRFDIDLHEAKRLLAKGCPQELALRILL